MIERTFPVEVEGIGTFTFKKRTLASQILIEGEAERMLGGPVKSKGLSDFAVAYNALVVLTVTAPPGWDLSDIDPVDEAQTEKVLRVHGRLRDAERTFRRGAAEVRPGLGATA